MGNFSTVRVHFKHFSTKKKIEHVHWHASCQKWFSVSSFATMFRVFMDRITLYTIKSSVQNNLPVMLWLDGPRQANLVLIAYASTEGSGEPAHPRSLARTSAARSYKQWVKRNLQKESQIPGPSEWLGMRSWNLSWRNARRHKFAWRGSDDDWMKFEEVFQVKRNEEP